MELKDSREISVSVLASGIFSIWANKCNAVSLLIPVKRPEDVVRECSVVEERSDDEVSSLPFFLAKM